jgi:hypothetical protein
MDRGGSPVGRTCRRSGLGCWAAPAGALLLLLACAGISRRFARGCLAAAATDKPEAVPDPAGPAQYAEEGPFPRLQDRVMSQLGFVNNLLVTLAVGVLAFAATALTDQAGLRAFGWRRWLLSGGLVLLAVSVLVGILVARNRLSALRISARTARLRQLRDRWRDQARAFEFDRLRRQADFFSGWGRYSLATKSVSVQVRMAAAALAVALPCTLRKAAPQTRRGPAGTAAVHAATDLVEALRAWSDKADDRTWRWLRWQATAFSVGALMLLIAALTIPS